MTHNRVRDIKHAQKESFLLREISKFLMQIIQNDSELQGMFVNRVRLSPDKSNCVIYLYTSEGKEKYKTQFKKLVLYKPSLRASLSKVLHGRYTPQLKFVYDETVDKSRRLEDLFDQMRKDEES